MHKIAKIIQNKIIELENSKKAQWLENYVKHNIKSRGVGIPLIRNIVKEISKKYSLQNEPLRTQIKFLDDLVSQEYTEDKLASIIFIQLNWEEIGVWEQLSVLSNWFDNKWIFDWNVCDWLCVKIFPRLIEKNPDLVIEELHKWNKHEYLWKARASLVGLVYCPSLKLYKDVIEEFSIRLINREERFAKTAVGWIMREYSKNDEAFVRGFVEYHIMNFTKETINNSMKYFNSKVRKNFLQKLP